MFSGFNINRGVINDLKNLRSLNIKNENGNGAVKSENTITNHVDKLLERGAVTVTKNLVTVEIGNSVGAGNYPPPLARG